MVVFIQPYSHICGSSKLVPHDGRGARILFIVSAKHEAGHEAGFCSPAQ